MQFQLPENVKIDPYALRLAREAWAKIAAEPSGVIALTIYNYVQDTLEGFRYTTRMTEGLALDDLERAVRTYVQEDALRAKPGASTRYDEDQLRDMAEEDRVFEPDACEAGVDDVDLVQSTAHAL